MHIMAGGNYMFISRRGLAMHDFADDIEDVFIWGAIQLGCSMYRCTMHEAHKSLGF